MFWFFFFHVSFTIFYFFQLGLKYVENNLLVPEGDLRVLVSPHQVLCVYTSELGST